MFLKHKLNFYITRRVLSKMSEGKIEENGSYLSQIRSILFDLISNMHKQNTGKKFCLPWGILFLS